MKFPTFLGAPTVSMGSSKDSRGLEDEYLVTWRYLEEGSLVGGIPTYPSEKYEEFVNWDHEIPN